MDFKWYDSLIKTDELEQGDLIPSCPIILPPDRIEENLEISVDVQLIDSIVLSQSYDLINNKLDIVLVCPFYSLKKFIEAANLPNPKEKLNLIKKLQTGQLPSYHLLNKSGDIHSLSDYQVVDFKNVYGIHHKVLKKVAGELDIRPRLLPPYREHLSQAFARYFMRVGLPEDIKVEGY